MARLLVAGIWAAAAAVAPLASAGRSAIGVDFFRAMEGAMVGRYTIQDNDLASLAGALKYVHTEVLTEHISAPYRSARKYGIDVIAKWEFRVLNPASLLSPTGSMVQNVDFGPFVTYDSGVATNTGQLEDIRRHGGYVGVQGQWDARFRYDDPYYWFSVNGFCPNLRWAEKGSEESPDPACLRSREGALVRGGLCAGQVREPTGDEACTYTYGGATVVRLDSLAGITEQDCGGRACADWADFRRNCSDATLRLAFAPHSGEVVRVPYCVEYDIAPACEANCEEPACLALPLERRELGLPFWRGRCSAGRNAWRSEQLAAAFGIPGATERHALDARPAAEEAGRCAYPSGTCNPSPLNGGMYCSRAWAGICQPCWIPGTVLPYPSTDQPYCPYDVLQSADYRGMRLSSPVCRSTRPQDLCCLYLSPSTCDPVPDLQPLPLDEDGFALAAFRQNTTGVATLLTRFATERLGATVANSAGLRQLAYWEWGRSPKKGRGLAAVEAAMGPFLAFPTTTGDAATTATTSPAAARAASTDSLGAASLPTSRLRGAGRALPSGPPTP